MSNRSPQPFLEPIISYFLRLNLRLWKWSLIRKYISLFAIGLILSWSGLACSPDANQTNANQRTAAAIAKADARVLRDSQGLVSNRDFYLANRDFAIAHQNIINALQEETQSVADWAKQNPKEVAQFLSPLLKIETPILEKVTKRRNYGFETITPVMIAEQQAIADTFYQIKLIPKLIQVKEAVLQTST